MLLLSTLHQTNEIAQSGKLEIIEFHNQTKAGVDALDQKVRHYSTCWKTKRWPQAVFYSIFDIAAYNALVLFKLRPPAQGFNFEKVDIISFSQCLDKLLSNPTLLPDHSLP